MKKYKISVCIISRPKEDLKKLMWSLKRQTYKPFEIVIHKEIGEFSKLRNKVIDKSKGEIIAFIDADCYASKYWLEEMNEVFQDKKIIGVWGRTSYELFGINPSISTRIVNNDGQGVSTSNAGFRAKILKKVKFDEYTNCNEDWIINERLKKYGKLIFNGDLIVFHMNQKWAFRNMIKHATYIDDVLKGYIKYGTPVERWGFIIQPKQFLVILFPPLILLTHSIRSWYDLKITLASLLEKYYTRWLIWRFSIKNKVFLL